MPKEPELDEATLKDVKEKLTALNGTSEAVKYFASQVAAELRPGIVPAGFSICARYVLARMLRENLIGSDSSLSAALLEHSIPHIGKETCTEDFVEGMMLYEPDPKYSKGEWKGYVCFNDSVKNALHNVGTRSYEIATVRGIQESHYETLEDFRTDLDRCKKLGFEDSLIGQLEILSTKVPSDKFPISFVRAQDPRVQAVITDYKYRRFIPLEELANQ